jgi:hypothetical protein
MMQYGVLFFLLVFWARSIWRARKQGAGDGDEIRAE